MLWSERDFLRPEAKLCFFFIVNAGRGYFKLGFDIGIRARKLKIHIQLIFHDPGGK